MSVFYIGAIVGGLLIGFISDHYGRVPALVVANTLAIIGGLSTLFAKSFSTFMFCRFLVGFAYDNCYTMFFIIVLEYTGVKWRTFVSVMRLLGLDQLSSTF